MFKIAAVIQRWLLGRHYRQLENEVHRFKRIVRGSEDYGFVEWNLKTNTIDWYGDFWEILGYQPTDLDSISDAKKLIDFIHPHDKAEFLQKLRVFFKSAHTHFFHSFRVKTKSGRFVWAEMRVSGDRDSRGVVSFLSGVVFDVSQLREAQEALRESEERHERIIQASNDGIWEWSARYGGFYFSARCWELLGFNEDEVVDGQGKENYTKWRERMAPEDVLKFDQVVEDHLHNDAPFDLEYRIRDKFENWRWIRARGQMVYDQNGEPSIMSGTIMDISDLKNAEQSFVSAKEDAESANRAKSDFLSAMSHELRTPLNAIIGFTQLFDLDHNLREDQRDNVNEIKKAGRHLLKLVNDVLDLAKIESGRFNFNLEPVSPVRIIENCISLTHTQTTDRNISVRFIEQSFEDFLIFVDPIRFKQIFINLISNAIKYNRASGRVYIRCEKIGENRIKIFVEDTGYGISSDKRKQLFEPFNRLGAENSSVEGSGVGLFITKEITEQMGGEIGFETELQKGSTFWVAFDLLDSTVEPIDARPESTAVEIPQLDVSSSKKVLYIEDNESNQRLLSQLLGRFPVFTLISADQSLHGLFLARTQLPDLIILDINLPGMDGFELVEVLKSDPKTKHIPVIALSANALQHDIEKGKQAGFDYYLAKPVDLAELVSVCNTLLD